MITKTVARTTKAARAPLYVKCDARPKKDVGALRGRPPTALSLPIELNGDFGRSRSEGSCRRRYITSSQIGRGVELAGEL
jgi:hypothetical protein